MPPKSVLCMRLLLLAHDNYPLAQVHRDFFTDPVLFWLCMCVAAFCMCTRAWHWLSDITLILRRSRTGTVWFYTSTSNKRAAQPKLYTKLLTRDLKRMYSRLTLVRISINL